MDYESKVEKTTIELFSKCKLQITNFEIDLESKNYNACKFNLNEVKVVFRKSKITPTKIGQFVTLWKRIKQNPIEPFSISDDFDFVIIFVKSLNHCGQFVFPKSILLEKGYIASDKIEGKRGFRVYPNWEDAKNKQALETQKWQLNYFIELPFEDIINTDVTKKYLKLLRIRKL